MHANNVGELVTQIDTFERRLAESDPSASPPIALDRLEQRLMQAGQQYVKELVEVGRSAQLPFGLVDRVSAGLTSSEGAASERLSMRQAALLRFAEDIFKYVASSCDLDPAAYAALQYLQLGTALVLIRDPQTLERRDHPLRLFCEYLIGRMKGYDQRSGERADALVKRLEHILIAAVDRSFQPALAPYETARKEIIAILAEYDKDSAEFAKSVVALAEGEAIRGDARLMVNRKILEIFANRTVPRVVLEFLQQIWRKYLYVTYLRVGLQSEQWQQGIEDMRVLANGFAIPNQGELMLYYEGQLIDALVRMRESVASICNDQAVVARFFDAINRILVEMMEGRLGENEPMVAINARGGHQTETPSLTADQWRRTAFLRIGSWYHIVEDQTSYRCQLIERNREHGYCLFVNLSGIRVSRLEYTEAIQAWEAGKLKSVDTSPVFDKAMEDALNRFAEWIWQSTFKAEEAERLRTKEHAQAKRRHQEQEQTKREAEVKEREARERLLVQLGEVVERLQPGGCVDFIDQNKNKIICKLGLKLKSSGKMIFVDALGRKVCELQPEELAVRIADGSAAILEYGAAFEDILQRLTAERRIENHVDRP